MFEPKRVNNVMIFDIYTYTGQEQSIKITPGSYLFQLWGANGGNNQSYFGGYGGFTSGVIQIYEFATLYLYVGGKGNYSQNPTGGFNGGGNGHIGGRRFAAGGGGGATDIRFNSKSLESRIIVAGGGGGMGVYYNNKYCPGGSGGGPIGLNGSQWNPTVHGQGATKTSGGEGGKYNVYNDYRAGDGEKLNGGNAVGDSYSGGGGGGGYYGGGGSYEAGGGGGSGYISPRFIRQYFLNGDEYAEHFNPKVEKLRKGNGLITITRLQKEATKPISQHFHIPTLSFFFISILYVKQ